MKPVLQIENLETLTRLQDTYENYHAALGNFAPLLKEKLELLDSDNGDGICLYTTLIDNLKQLDGTYIQDLLKDDLPRFRLIFTKLVMANEVQLDGNKIIVVRGTPKALRQESKISVPTSVPEISTSKKPTRPPRRLSFPSLKVYDGDKILTTEDLLRMTDLKYLFSLNAYHLPGCDSTKERGIYEHFFDNFLKLVLQEPSSNLEIVKPETIDGYVYLILQETIFMLHTVVELFVNVIECLLEMVTFMQLRIKTASSMTTLRVSLREPSNPVLAFVILNFNDPERAFVDFATRKLIKPNGRQDTEWISKFSGYAAMLTDAIELYDVQCDDCVENLKRLKDRGAVSFFSHHDAAVSAKLNLARAFCNNIMVFIGEFKNLLKHLREGPLYRDFCQQALTLLRLFDDIETVHPVKYGRSRRSSVSALNRSGSSTPQSTEGSPRTSGVDDSPLMTGLSRLVSALVPGKK